METLYTKTEVAEYMKVSVRTVSRLIQDTDVPVYRIRSKVRIPQSSVMKMMEGSNSKENNNKLINQIMEV